MALTKKQKAKILEAVGWIMGAIVIGIAIYGVIIAVA